MSPKKKKKIVSGLPQIPAVHKIFTCYCRQGGWARRGYFRAGTEMPPEALWVHKVTRPQLISVRPWTM